MTKTAQHRKWNSGIRRRVASAALTLAVALGLGVVSTHSAQAQTYKEHTLYSFTRGRGKSQCRFDFRRAGKPLWHHVQWRRFRQRNSVQVD